MISSMGSVTIHMEDHEALQLIEEIETLKGDENLKFATYNLRLYALYHVLKEDLKNKQNIHSHD